jgi:hypothetical protein
MAVIIMMTTTGGAQRMKTMIMTITKSARVGMVMDMTTAITEIPDAGEVIAKNRHR